MWQHRKRCDVFQDLWSSRFTCTSSNHVKCNHFFFINWSTVVNWQTGCASSSSSNDFFIIKLLVYSRVLNSLIKRAVRLCIFLNIFVSLSWWAVYEDRGKYSNFRPKIFWIFSFLNNKDYKIKFMILSRYEYFYYYISSIQPPLQSIARDQRLVSIHK